VGIFKAYDIRGVVPDELDAAVAYGVGRATARFLGEGPLVVGRDARLSSPELFRELLAGVPSKLGDLTAEDVEFLLDQDGTGDVS